MASTSTLAVDNESEPARASSLTNTALAAPMARAVRKPPTSLLGAMETKRTSPSSDPSRSCRAISTPYESDSSRMSLTSRLRVFVSGSRTPGSAGSGICFTHTTMFMVRILPSLNPFPTNSAHFFSPGHPSPQPSPYFVTWGLPHVTDFGVR